MSAHPLTAESCDLRQRWRLPIGLWALLVAGLPVIAGCQSPMKSSAVQSSSRSLAGLMKPSADDDRPSIDGIMGPTERQLKQASWEDEQREAAAAGTTHQIGGLVEYQAAEKLYEEGRYPEAEKAFKRLAKDRANGGLSFSERTAEVFQTGITNPTDNFGDPVEEDALFMLAEAQFMQKKYSWSQDSYDRLLEKYPSSRHLNDVTRRLFAIAQSWMGFPDVNKDNNVELASGNLQKTNPRTGDRTFKRPSFFNFTNRSRPVFDTAGRALQALQSIWLNDANGPLADDALMLTANYHLQTGDFVEAARVYQLLREQYPDSPHYKDAYLLDSHVRLASYEGPAYDDRALKDSRDLRETAQRLFPDLTPDERGRLESELQRIEVSEVAREWHKVEFYQSKGKGYEPAVALYCNVILKRFPDSPYAERAHKTLNSIADTRRSTGSNPFAIFTGPQKPVDSPVLVGIGTPPATNHEAARRESPTAALPSDPPTGAATTQKPGFMKSLLTPVRETPKLQPVESGTANTQSTNTGSQPPRANRPRRSLF